MTTRTTDYLKAIDNLPDGSVLVFDDPSDITRL